MVARTHTPPASPRRHRSTTTVRGDQATASRSRQVPEGATGDEPPPGRRDRGKRDKLARIVAAARTLFAERGFDATTTQEIAQHAGIAAGTLFRYVQTKEDLLLLAFLEELATETDEAAASVVEGEPLVDQLLHVFDRVLAYHDRDRDLSRHLLREASVIRNAEWRDQAASLASRMQVHIVELLSTAQRSGDVAPDVDLALSAGAIFALHFGLLAEWTNGFLDADQHRAKLRAMIKLLLRGLAPRDGGSIPQASDARHRPRTMTDIADRTGIAAVVPGPGMRQSDANRWRLSSIGRLLANALRRFEGRMFDLLAQSGHVEARMSHLTLTRNLDVSGTRASELARRAGISKQAMGELIMQCEALGLVGREADPKDARAKIITFTPRGSEWFGAFRTASERAEMEVCQELGILRVDGLKAALHCYAGFLDPLAAGSAATGDADYTAPRVLPDMR